MSLVARVREFILGARYSALEGENRELREHILKLSGYDSPKAEMLAPHMEVETIKKISADKFKRHRRSMSWSEWGRRREAELDKQRMMSRVAGEKQSETL